MIFQLEILLVLSPIQPYIDVIANMIFHKIFPTTSTGGTYRYGVKLRDVDECRNREPSVPRCVELYCLSEQLIALNFCSWFFVLLASAQKTAFVVKKRKSPCCPESCLWETRIVFWSWQKGGKNLIFKSFKCMAKINKYCHCCLTCLPCLLVSSSHYTLLY